MKKISFWAFLTVLNFTFAQGNKFRFESNERLVSVEDTIELTAFTDGTDDGTLKWKIAGEEGKDWKFVKGSSATDNTIKVYFKKIGPTNIGISAKQTKSITKKVNGKDVTETVKETIKYEKKGYLLVTAKGEYDELNQLYAEGDLESYIKLVKKASKLTENEKYAKDPFAFIWLARGLYAVSASLTSYEGKYEPYKTAFGDAITALSKALKYDNNGFLEDSKFSDLIYELQNKYYVEILGEQVEKDADKIDYAKISGVLNKYAKITKNPICIKYFQVACMFRTNDANAKNFLKETDAQLAQLGDSAVFTETDKMFFSTGIVQLGKYYEFKKQPKNICDLLKKSIIAVPSLLEEQGKFEEFRDMLDGCQ
jgi:hypothetical protein